MAYSTQLWASLQDLRDLGPPVETLQVGGLIKSQKIAALRAASAQMAFYVRSRYGADSLPVALNYSGSSGFTTGGVSFLGNSISEATSLSIKIGPSGGVVGSQIAVLLDEDGSESYAGSGVIPASGIYDINGLQFIYTGSLPADAIATASAGIGDYGIRQHVVNIAVYNLLINRGLNPANPEWEIISKRYDDAIKCGEGLVDQKVKLNEALDATPLRNETGPRWGGSKNPWDFMNKGKCKKVYWW